MVGYRIVCTICTVLLLIVSPACTTPTGAISADSHPLGVSTLVEAGDRPAAAVVQSAAVLGAFEPKPDGRDTRIEFKFVELVLRATVLRTGPSERMAYSRPEPLIGYRLVLRDTSRFRLEGNKVVYSLMSDKTKRAVTECLESLVALGQRLDIPSLPRNEQLAYWFNLHNMLVIATIMEHGRVAEPRTLTFGPDKTPFHEAPLVTLKGIPLSLNDIRIGIVYRFWSDPRVMYGFFRGDLASPNIRAEAWKADTLSSALNDNAREFINALRGVRRRGVGELVVSPVYDEARDRFFPGWPADLRAHLLEFAGPEVRIAIHRATEVVYGEYERRTADLTGGAFISPSAQSQALTSFPDGSALELWSPAANPAIGIALAEIRAKDLRLWLRRRRGRVEIEDAPFTDEPSEEIE